MEFVKIIHVLSGFLGLSSGILILLLPGKGNNYHKKLGMLYFISMMISSIVSIYLSIVLNKAIFICIGIFTLYMLISGFLSLPVRYYKFKYIITPFMLIGLISGGFMIYTMNVFLVVFGAILLSLIIQDMLMLIKKEVHRLDLLGSHSGKMIGSFIAASTAFIVNVIFSGNLWWHWLLPTFVFTPVIIYWGYKLGQKKKRLIREVD